jgi:hypothetical protein
VNSIAAIILHTGTGNLLEIFQPFVRVPRFSFSSWVQKWPEVLKFLYRHLLFLDHFGRWRPVTFCISYVRCRKSHFQFRPRQGIGWMWLNFAGSFDSFFSLWIQKGIEIFTPPQQSRTIWTPSSRRSDTKSRSINFHFGKAWKGDIVKCKRQENVSTMEFPPISIRRLR